MDISITEKANFNVISLGKCSKYIFLASFNSYGAKFNNQLAIKLFLHWKEIFCLESRE